MLNAWYVWVGGAAATFAVLEAARRFCVGVFKGVRSFVRLADALPELLAMPHSLRAHADDDAAFQEWIIQTLDHGGPIRFESEEPAP